MQRVKGQLKDLEPITEKCHINLTIYRDSNRLLDIQNFTILEKFTTDAIVKAGILIDDNWKHITGVTIIDGGKSSEPMGVYELIPVKSE